MSTNNEYKITSIQIIATENNKLIPAWVMFKCSKENANEKGSYTSFNKKMEEFCEDFLSRETNPIIHYINHTDNESMHTHDYSFAFRVDDLNKMISDLEEYFEVEVEDTLKWVDVGNIGHKIFGVGVKNLDYHNWELVPKTIAIHQETGDAMIFSFEYDNLDIFKKAMYTIYTNAKAKEQTGITTIPISLGSLLNNTKPLKKQIIPYI